MRDIKFRAWDKYKKEMHIVSEMNWNIFSEEIEIISTGYKDNSCLAYNRNHSSEKCDIGALEIMQYTGLKDEKENEIYEGDIIDFSYDMFVGNFDTFIAKGVVVFDEGAFYVELFENERTTKDEAYLLYGINIDTIEVIGNIYDNPELLEKGAEDEQG